jgi:hypothetical protein
MSFFLKERGNNASFAFAESDDQRLLEKQGFGFFGLKTHIDLKYLEKH